MDRTTAGKQGMPTLIVLLSLLAGCGPQRTAPVGASPASAPVKETVAAKALPSEPLPTQAIEKKPNIAPAIPAPPKPAPMEQQRPSLETLLAEAEQKPEQQALDPTRFPLPTVNEALCKARGIRKVESEHLILYTDLPLAPAVDELPRVFDLALPQWCEYFHIPPERMKSWRMVAVIAKSKDLFINTGLWPEDLPGFLHAFTRGAQCWCEEQPSDYYRRHLLLHEGVHGFMYAALSELGPPWYAEGVAELLSTHRWEQQQLQLGVMPHAREAFEAWGRIKVIKDDLRRDRGLLLPQIMQYPAPIFREVEPYAWSWAASIFLNDDPSLQTGYRGLQAHVSELATPFATKFWNDCPLPAGEVNDAWQWFVMHLDYGYDLERERFKRAETIKEVAEPADFTLSCEQGWQATGLQLTSGTRYRVTATGQFQVAGDPQSPWISEADGVTLRYYRGQPLGKLLAVVSDAGKTAGPSPFLSPRPLGSAGELTANRTGQLYLRVNDSPSEWRENRGTLQIRVQRIAE